MSVRPARVTDTRRLHEIIGRIYGDYGDVLDTVREDPHLQEPCGYFRKDGGELWVAEGIEAKSARESHSRTHEAIVVGCAARPEHGGLETRSTVVAGSGGVVFRLEEAEIKTVYVAHEFRRRGIARHLVELAIGHARASRGTRAKIMLWSDVRFGEAHALYESLGFVRGGVRHVSITNSFSEYRYDLPVTTL